MQPADGRKIGPLAVPANPLGLGLWLFGNIVFAFFIYWTADSFFPGTELTPTAMMWKLGTAGISFAIGLWLMHINHE